MTADTVGSPDDLKLEARVNGIAHQSTSTADMLFSTAELIAYVSRFTPLATGDILVTGTPRPHGSGRWADKALATR